MAVKKKNTKSVKSKSPINQIKKGLAIAIQTEVEGYEFYRLASVKTKDAGAKKMFESLANDEINHHNMLRENFAYLANEMKFKPFRKPSRSRLSFKSPVFSKSFLLSRRQKNFEMSALSIGILLEQNSIEFYKAQLEIAPDNAAKSFFRDLITWEGEHLRALIAQKQFLQREIFAQARFEPF